MKCFVLTCFVCFYKVTDTFRPQLHTILSNSELRKYLDTDSQDKVPEYDLTQLVRHIERKRSSRSTQKRYSLSTFGKHMELVLNPNDNVIGRGGLSVERKTADGLLTKEIYHPRGRFYEGHVTSDSESHVAVRETGETGELSGAIMSDGHLYKIEPLPRKLRRRIGLKETGHHVISRRIIHSILSQTKTIPFSGKKHTRRDDNASNQQGVYSGPVFIEAMLTADKTTCDYYGNGTLEYLIKVANLINRLYKDSSIGMNVNWVLVKVFMLEGFDPDLDIAANNIRSAAQYLGKFRSWSAVRNVPDGISEHYDHAALLTREMCGLESCYIDGLAYYNVPCSNDWGVSINDARGLSVAYTVAHEMGHNIGLPHDSGDCAKGYIMHSMQSSGPNAFRWSSCSKHRLKKIFTKKTCFHNKPPKQLPGPTLPSGYITDIDKQCQLAHGIKFRACPSLRESCGALYCTQSGGSCYSRGAPVAEGTKCGHRKWCRAGKCSDVGSFLPPPVDGGWGSWGSYSACTRTCGGGVKYRSRKCINPAPQYFGEYCKGSSKGYFKMCSTQECTVDRFRQEQCEKYNIGSTRYRAYFMGGAKKCMLACVTGRKGSFFGHVKDGTRCESNPYVYDVCIEGKCIKVGCDKKLNSGKVYDRCLNCGGDGSSCILRTGLYTKDYRVYGRQGDTMVIIPRDATQVSIRELGKSKNFLSVRSDQTGRYYVPVPSWTATYKAVGTSIYHKMDSINFAEIIHIRGPTNEALQAMYIYSGIHANPGIAYSFYIPGNGGSTRFMWKQANEGSCSASCAGGVQLIKVTCHREDDHSEVTPVYCDNSSKPAESVPCNQAPCPRTFQPGVWSPCSEKCGGGQQYRNVTCVQVITKGVTNILTKSECAHLSEPVRIQKCNQIDCLPEWIPGNWTKCSVPCGGGNKSRAVECRKKLGNGTWITLPSHYCSDLLSEKPHNTTQCHTTPCHKWRVQYPCVSCGGSDSSYVPIGCFQDNRVRGRPLPEMVGNHRNNIDWHNMSSTVNKCAQDAWRNKYAVFGVQFYGECWSGITGYKTYDKDGFNLHGCWEGVGRSLNNYVYAFTSLVVEPLVDCIYTVTNQTVSEDNCDSPKPDAKMKLCSHACSHVINIR